MNLLFVSGFGFTPQIWNGQIDYFNQTLPTATVKAIGCLEPIVFPEAADQNVVVGWSLGALFALEAAAAEQGNVDKLVLVSGFPRFLEAADFPLGMRKAEFVQLRQKIKRNYADGMNSFYNLVDAEFDRDANLSGWNQQQAVRAFEILEEHDLRPLISQIKIPTLIIAGDSDRVVNPGVSSFMRQNIVGAQMKIFPGGHAPFLTNAARFNTLLAEFIASK